MSGGIFPGVICRGGICPDTHTITCSPCKHQALYSSSILTMLARINLPMSLIRLLFT